MTYQDFRREQRSFSSAQGILKYIDKGTGPALLLLHGVPTSSWLYRKMIDQLADSGYRVIAPDMLGFGSSSSPKGYEVYNQKQHATRLLALMDSLKIEQWTHVFHDAGGLWTWELLAMAPNRVSKLVILNTIIYVEGFDPPVRMEKNFITQFTMWLYRNGVTTNLLLKQLFKVGLVHDSLTEEEVEGYRRPLLEGKTRAMFYFFSQTCNALPDYSKVIKGLDIPAMVIWGKHDEMLEWLPQEKKVMNDLKIEAQDVHLIEAKHFIQEEKPAQITKLILDFIS